MKRKKTYGFSVILTAPTLSADECDALYEAGCDDGTIVTRNRVTYIAFDRKADSLEKAIRSATANIRAAGLEVERVEMPGPWFSRPHYADQIEIWGTGELRHVPLKRDIGGVVLALEP